MEVNPGRVNDRDRIGTTPLVAAVSLTGGLSLVVWLLDEKGADENATTAFGISALSLADSLEILTSLLARGADPTIANCDGVVPLMQRAAYGSVNVMARLLQKGDGHTVLHHACATIDAAGAALKVDLLLQAGGDPTVANGNGCTPLDYVREYLPSYHAAIALLEQALAEAEKASLLVKARRLAVTTNSNTVAPSCLQAQSLPRIALAPPMDDHNGEEKDEEEWEEICKLCTTLALVCGLERGGMPRDVFRVVMDLVMPAWDPLGRKNVDTAPPALQDDM